MMFGNVGNMTVLYGWIDATFLRGAIFFGFMTDLSLWIGGWVFEGSRGNGCCFCGLYYSLYRYNRLLIYHPRSGLWMT